jgi:nucleoid-associated protein YgaU
MVDEEKKDPQKNIADEIASHIGRPVPPRPEETVPGGPNIQGSQMQPNVGYPDLRAEQARKAAEAAAAAAADAVIKHVWTKEDTYASLALKYYGSFKEPYWRLIYNHNKNIIGDHPNDIRVGLEIEIPPLPDELKKK